MNTCDRFEELISSECDGALTPEENALLAAHLEECESCRRFREILGAVGSLPMPELPVPAEVFTAQVMDRVHTEAARAKVRPIPGRSRYAGWAAAAVAVLAIGIVGVRGGAARARATESYALTTASGTAFMAAAAPEAAMEERDAILFCEAMDESAANDALVSFSAEYNGISFSLPTEVLENSVPAEMPGRDSDLYMESDGRWYQLWLEDELVIWCEDGTDTAMLSPLSAEELQELIF